MEKAVAFTEAVSRVQRMTSEFRIQKQTLGFLDSNLWLGRPREPSFRRRWDIDALRGSMQRYRIEGGIVTHNAAVIEDPYSANGELLALMGDDEQLWGALVLTTELPAGYTRWGDYLDRALSLGARMVRLFPMSHRFSLERWCSGSLLDAVHERRIPLTLWHIEAGWAAIKMLCETYPDLPVIVEGRPQKILYHNRYFYPLLERFGNLHLELHNLNVYLGIEDLVERFGPKQLIFGSCLPFNDPNTSQMMVTAARIPQEAKEAIARGNLARLLREVQLP